MKRTKIATLLLAGTFTMSGIAGYSFSGKENPITNPIVASAAIDNNIGSGLSWSLSNNNKTLTITGSGTMKDFSSASAVPWRGKASEITKVVLSDGLKNIGSYAFANFSSLKVIIIPENVEKIGAYSFYNSGLEIADLAPKTRIIQESAFYNTPFSRNYFTSEETDGMNAGSAKKMVGRQVVVNVFLNQLSANVNEKTAVKIEEEVDPEREVVFWHEPYNSPTAPSHQRGQYYRADKDSIGYQFISNFGVGNEVEASYSHTAGKLKNLDDQRYFDSAYYNSKSDIKDKGNASFITSDKIRSTLNSVNDALSALQSDAAEYGKNLSFITNKSDTNFYFTYSNWDDKNDPHHFDGNPYMTSMTDSFKHAYIEGKTADYTNYSQSPASFDNYDAVTAFANRMNEQYGRSLEEGTGSDGVMSEYSEYLKQKYRADGVIYLFHYGCDTIRDNDGSPTEGIAFNQSKQVNGRRIDEYCRIFRENSAVIKHEICHLYGSKDYYFNMTQLSNVQDNPFAAYVSNYNADDIMMSGSKAFIGADTARFIGWSDNMLKDSYEFISNSSSYRKNKGTYKLGDVNMNGTPDDSYDTYRVYKYNSYKNNPLVSSVLTPVEKALGRIVISK
jgi:hypothetical protein